MENSYRGRESVHNAAPFTTLSRREFLQRLTAAYGTSMLGCRRGDPFGQEHVCIHIFRPTDAFPAPLLEKSSPATSRSPDNNYFSIGVPELVVCTTQTRFGEMFQYFWPFSRSDLARLQESIAIRYSKPVIGGTPDVDDFTQYLHDHGPELAQGRVSSAVIFIFNDFTRHWAPQVIASSRQAVIHEFVLFKDPTQEPYLCTYPAIQKGFRRPPP